MPFKSEKQRRFLWAEHPEIAKRWAHKYPESNKGLPMYADKKDDTDKKAALDVLARAVSSFNQTRAFPNNGEINGANAKKANSGMIYIDVPQGDKPTYAGEDREKGKQTEGEKQVAHCDGEKADQDAVSAVFGKLAVVLAPKLREMWEQEQALTEGREPLFVPENLGVRRYSIPSPVVPPPMGMAPQAPAQAGMQPMAQPANTPVGGGSHPQHNPIQAFGPLGAKGQINGNAAFGQKNSPDSLKTSSLKILTSIDFSGLPDPDDLDLDEDERTKSAAKPCSCGCGDTVPTCKCSSAQEFGEKLAQELELSLPAQVAVMAALGGGAGIRHGGLAGLTGGGIYGAINPGEYVDEKGQKQKRTRLQGAAQHGFENAGKLGLIGGGLGAATAGSLPLVAELLGDKSAGLGTALARGTARGVENYNEDVRNENSEQRDNPDYAPQQEVSDSSGALLALLLGGGGLALAHGPSLMGKMTGGSRGRRTKRATAKDIFDIVQGA
jgi:hypothetical protein